MAIMDIKAFIGTDVVIEKTKSSCVLTEITAPYIQVQTKAPNSSGYPSTYRFETVNGDPFTNNLLKFEDSSLLELFIKAYKEYKERQEEDREREIYEIIMENVERYDGTGAGQKDVPIM